MSGWADISTAPRNGGEPYLCYSPGNPRAHNEGAREPHFRIDSFSDRWKNGRHQYPEAPYTHWMPLPKAPRA